MSRPLRSVALLVFLALVGFGAGVGSYALSSRRVLPQSTFVGQIHVGRRSLEEALALVAAYDSRVRETTVPVKVADNDTTLSASDIGFGVDLGSVRDRLDSILNPEDIIRRLLVRLGRDSTDYRVRMPVSYEEESLSDFIQSVESLVYTPPEDAWYDFRTRRFAGGRYGSGIDRRSVESAVLSRLERADGSPMVVEVVPLEPEISLEYLNSSGIEGVVNQFSTGFSPTDQNRVANIRLSAELVNNTLLMPGDVFSFNDTVGPRTVERGFREAMEIVNNQFVIGVGGGVCQVSSTLYNVVLRSGMEIIERRPHSRAVSYVGAGLDATVYYGVVDFQFGNSLDHPVLLAAQTVGDQLHVGIATLDEALPRVTVTTAVIRRLEPELIRVRDPDLARGVEVVDEEPKEGLVVETRRNHYTATGSLLRTEVVSVDRYAAIDGRARYGT